MADTYRENRKNELRRRVVDTDRLLEQEKNRKHEDRVVKGPHRILVFLLILIIILVMVAAGYYFLHRQYQSFTVNWTSDFTAEEGAVESDYEDYQIYGEGLLKVTRDGATYINSAGKVIWNQAYEMNNPYVTVNGDYCAIGDQGKTTIFIMNTSGTTGQAETNLPINKLSVSETGVVYALLEDSAASYITVFTREGAALDISIKSILDGDGYPVDISVSPDGTELIASFAYIEAGSIQNKIIFYNLDEIGQNAGNNRVVGGFTDDFTGHLAGRVHFSDNTHAQAFYDGGIAFFSTKVLTSPELLNKVEIPDTIRSITYSGDYVGAITLNSDENVSAAYNMTIYRVNGQTVFSVPVSFNVTGFDIDNGMVFLYNDKNLRVYDMRGNIKYDGSLDRPVSKVKAVTKSAGPFGMDILVGSSGFMESVKLK
ncbi:DUF5711 family protein [Oribacterium sp. WCC10]|uniref:DUF5711 family protein n=1 Tax=Oribacterium sp. WCC10 TaxID=1855343 RepID=UPI0008EE7CDD|nr:DUF5711 family protein [Oribacterium sp. WCC10]SFG15708.1 hypothetical protein SAMN05216356_102206 [Oribacterium sp. WCC10]